MFLMNCINVTQLNVHSNSIYMLDNFNEIGVFMGKVLLL